MKGKVIVPDEMETLSLGTELWNNCRAAAGSVYRVLLISVSVVIQEAWTFLHDFKATTDFSSSKTPQF